MPDRLRLAELPGGLSIVADLGYSLPPGEALRACVLGTRLATSCGLNDSEVSHTFYTALLRHIGCLGFAHYNFTLTGDDLQANAAAQRTDFADIKSLLITMIPGSTRGSERADT